MVASAPGSGSGHLSVWGWGTGDAATGVRAVGARARGHGAATHSRWTLGRAVLGSVATAVGPRRAAARGGAARGCRGRPSGNTKAALRMRALDRGEGAGACRGGKAPHVGVLVRERQRSKGVGGGDVLRERIKETRELYCSRECAHYVPIFMMFLSLTCLYLCVGHWNAEPLFGEVDIESDTPLSNRIVIEGDDTHTLRQITRSSSLANWIQ
jgi:hypothetical protein